MQEQDPNPIPGPVPAIGQDPAVLQQLAEGVAQAQQQPQPQAPPQLNSMEQAEAQPPVQQPPPRVPGTSSLGQYQGTKGQIFRNMLGDFLYSAGKGLAAAGHGPEANARGAGEAITAVHERGIQQQQIAMQQQALQSQEAYRQAQAQQYEPTPVQVNGETVMMPAIAARQVIAAQERARIAGQAGMGKQALANVGGVAKQEKANEGALAVANVKAGATSSFGKLTPEMAAIGLPPDPKDFPAGTKDPAFNQEVQKYGQAVSALKQQNLMAANRARGESFAYGRAKYMQVPVLDSTTQEMGFKTPLEIAASGNQLKPLAEADKMMMKNAMFEDIKGAAGNLRKAVQANPQGFTAPQIAKMTAAMDSDPSGGLFHSTITNLIQAGGKDSLSPAQQNVAIAMQQAYENAYALRGVAGMGQGSDELRRAIRNTLPGPSSPQGYALKQLTAFEQQVNRLHRGVPNIPLRNAGDTGQGTVRMQTSDGKIWEIAPDKVPEAQKRGAKIVGQQ